MTQPEHTLSAETVQTLVSNHKRFLDFLERRVGSREIAEEILQAAYVKSVERGGELRDEERAVAWFYRLLRNAVIDHYRSAGAQARALDRLEREVANAEPPDEEMEKTICACMGDLIPTLKPEYATLLKQVELEGKSVKEVAEGEGISANNAAVRLFRARQALKQQLERTCGTCTTHGCLDCSCSSAHK